MKSVGSTRRLRIGLFGGTFDPIHIGHLSLVLDVKHEIDLDVVYLIPCATPPHKTKGPFASARDRVEMIRLSVSGNSDILVSDIELKRQGPSYTIDTVCALKTDFPRHDLFFIVGMDAFLEIDTWKSYKELFEIIPFIVVTRPGVIDETEQDVRSVFEEFLQGRISRGYHRKEDPPAYVHEKYHEIHFIDTKPVDISSTTVREKIRNGMIGKIRLPDKVREYITSKGLYQ